MSLRETTHIALAVMAVSLIAISAIGSVCSDHESDGAPDPTIVVNFHLEQFDTYLQMEVNLVEGRYPFTLPTDTPVREGYTFLGWSGQYGATEPDLLPGDYVTNIADYATGSVASQNRHLYAVWESDVAVTLEFLSSPEVGSGGGSIEFVGADPQSVAAAARDGDN